MDSLEDYFDYNRFYVLHSKGEHIKLLKKFLSNQSIPKAQLTNIQSVWKIYTSLNNRVFLDSLIMHHSVEHVAQATKLHIDQVSLYKDLFFTLDVSNRMNKSYFYESIKVPDVYEWYKKTEILTIQDMMFLISGEEREAKAEKIISIMTQRCFNIFMTATSGILNPESIKDGITKQQKDLYEIGIKAGQLITQLSRTYFQYENIINKDINSFFKEWNFLLDNNTELFKQVGYIPDEIEDQINTEE
jgi:hypothetical protein